MFTDPLTLFDQTIDNLETLAAVLADELDERVQATAPEHSGLTAYRAAHIRIGSLLPALRAARIAQEQTTRSMFRNVCVNCD
jgi:hypothetical protein